jgi:hypothetical protein
MLIINKILNETDPLSLQSLLADCMTGQKEKKLSR